MVWHPNAPQGRETDKVRFDAWMYIGGEGLDIGCGNCKVHPNAVGIDQIRIGGAPLGDMCADGRSLKQFTDESFDYVYSSHFLEHVIDYEATLAEWWRVVKVGGYLILYLPHRDYYPRMGQHGSNPDHKHDFHPDDIKKAMWRITKSGEVPSFDVVEDEDRVGGNEYSFFQVFRKCEVGEGRYDPWVTCRARLKTDGTRTVCISRYGAVGDTAFLASIAAQYKRNGWYVVVHTSPIGVDLLRHDDSIDELYSFNNDGVFFLGTLEPFWQHLARRYDRVINLTQSVEGQLLPSPEHVYHGYPLDVRQKLLSVSYMERMHDIAGVEHNWDGMRFAATIEEMHWAKGMQNTLSRREAPNGMQYRAPIIGVCLAGSACHKVYPFQHMAIARLMLEVDCSVILFGGPEDLPHEELVCQTALAMGIDPKRIARSCGKQWTLRKSLAVSVWCDLLLGPETGILQWNAMQSNRKIVLLSHSSAENLTKHWLNTVALRHPTPCGPCHRKHNDWTWCVRGGSGASACMEFPVDTIVGAIRDAFQIKEAITLDGSSSTQSEVREESRRAARDSTGVQPSRQGRLDFEKGNGAAPHDEAWPVNERTIAHNALTHQAPIDD